MRKGSPAVVSSACRVAPRMKFTLLLVSLFVSGVLLISIRALSRERNLWRMMQLGGAVCLAVMVFAHIAEEFHFFARMGWGLPHSSGHYVDLASAMLGLTLLPVGFCADAMLRKRSTKSKRIDD